MAPEQAQGKAGRQARGHLGVRRRAATRCSRGRRAFEGDDISEHAGRACSSTTRTGARCRRSSAAAASAAAALPREGSEEAAARHRRSAAAARRRARDAEPCPRRHRRRAAAPSRPLRVAARDADRRGRHRHGDRDGRRDVARPAEGARARRLALRDPVWRGPGTDADEQPGAGDLARRHAASPTWRTARSTSARSAISTRDC